MQTLITCVGRVDKVGNIGCAHGIAESIVQFAYNRECTTNFIITKKVLKFNQTTYVSVVVAKKRGAVEGKRRREGNDENNGEKALDLGIARTACRNTVAISSMFFVFLGFGCERHR